MGIKSKLLGLAAMSAMFSSADLGISPPASFRSKARPAQNTFAGGYYGGRKRRAEFNKISRRRKANKIARKSRQVNK